MNIDAMYKRAVRIVGKPDLPHGKGIIVSDALTGEQITNVESATIFLSATVVSTVKLTYYETNKEGHIITDARHNPLIGTTTIKSEKHEIDVPAYEVNE